MIDMKCPSCGAGGRVPREKVNTRLVCKKCLRVFHITASGNTVLGEPAAPKDQPKPHSQRESTRHDTAERFDDVTSRLSQIKLPRVSPKALAIVGSVVLLSALGYWFFSRQTVEARSLAVARAIQMSDMKLVIDLAVPETALDTIQWYNDAYKQYLDLKTALGGQEAGITIEPQGTPQGGNTQVKVLYSKGGARFDGSLYTDALQPNPSRAHDPTTLELALFWTSDAWGNWLLDGSKTFGRK
jgi:hypothetical protein